MLRFILTIIVMIFLGFALSLYLPWWVFAPVCFLVVAVMPVRPLPAFLAGFVSMLLYWGGFAAWISIRNHHLLAGKVSRLLFRSEDPWLPILATAAIAALLGGLSALSASFAFYRQKSKEKKSDKHVA